MCNPLTIIMIKWCLTPFLGIFIQQSHKVFFIFFYSYSKYIYYFQITLFFFVYERIWSHYFFVFMYQWIFGMFLSSYGCTIINNNDKEKAVFFLNKLLFIILFINNQGTCTTSMTRDSCLCNSYVLIIIIIFPIMSEKRNWQKRITTRETSKTSR